MGYAFISYSSKNQSSADAMRILLNSKGIDTWMAPGDIPAGSKYAGVIKQALSECSCLVLMLSQATQNSEWVPKEVERAIHYKKTIIPVQIEDVVLTDEFDQYLCNTHIISVNKIDEESAAIKNLINSISVCVGYSFTDLKSEGFTPNLNDSVFFGRYQQNVSDSNIRPPIEWLIKDFDKEKLLLVSKYCLDVKAYNQSINKPTTWAECSLRKWLNQFFYESAFLVEEKDSIIQRILSNEDNYESGAPGGVHTTDKVFVLSASEADKYFKTDKDRIAFGTQIAKQQYMQENESLGLKWWLRMPGYYDYRAAIVNEDGSLDYDGYSASRGFLAVRPAMWVKYGKGI